MSNEHKGGEGSKSFRDKLIEKYPNLSQYYFQKVVSEPDPFREYQEGETEVELKEDTTQHLECDRKNIHLDNFFKKIGEINIYKNGAKAVNNSALERGDVILKFLSFKFESIYEDYEVPPEDKDGLWGVESKECKEVEIGDHRMESVRCTQFIELFKNIINPRKRISPNEVESRLSAIVALFEARGLVGLVNDTTSGGFGLPEERLFIGLVKNLQEFEKEESIQKTNKTFDEETINSLSGIFSKMPPEVARDVLGPNLTPEDKARANVGLKTSQGTHTKKLEAQRNQEHGEGKGA